MALIQSDEGVTSSTDTVSASLTGVTTGNTIIAVIVCRGTTNGASTVEDGTNTYTKRSGRTFITGAGGVEIWESTGVTGGNLTLTVTLLAASGDNILHMIEFSDLVAYRTQATTSGTSTTPSVDITTDVDNALIVGGVVNQTATFTEGGSYTPIILTTSGPIASSEYQVAGAAGTYAVDGTLASSFPWAVCAVSFSQTAAGGATWPGYIAPFGWR